METARVFYTASTVQWTGTMVPLGVWIAPTADPTCFKLLALQRAMGKAGLQDFDIWRNTDGLRLRAMCFACSQSGVRKKAARLASLTAHFLGFATGLSELRDLAAVERTLT